MRAVMVNVEKLSGDSSGTLPGAAGPAESAASVAARVRWLMIISALTTAIAIAAVLGVIGYRVFRAGESRAGTAAGGPPAAAIVRLPKGARVIATAVAGDRVV